MFPDLFYTSGIVDADVTAQLSSDREDLSVVVVRPPRTGDIPSKLSYTVDAVFDLSTSWFGLVNTSPIVSYELVRNQPETLKIQFTLPNDRLERAIRTHLPLDTPQAKMTDGSAALPVEAGDVIGGGYLSLGRRDWYPQRTEFNEPAINSVVASLHRHILRGTKFVVQVIWKPSIVGRPFRRYWWRKKGYRRVGFLRREKHRVTYQREATPRERRQADAIEDKLGSRRYRVAIRFLVIGSEHVMGRVKELSQAFSTFENQETGQFFDTTTVKSWRRRHIVRFAEIVWQRQFGRSSTFQLSRSELSSLVGVPSLDQANIRETLP